MYNEIVKNFGSFKNNELEAVYINFLNNLHEKFLNHVNLILDKLENFWKYLSDPEDEELNKTTLDNKFN